MPTAGICGRKTCRGCPHLISDYEECYGHYLQTGPDYCEIFLTPFEEEVEGVTPLVNDTTTP